MNEYLGMMRTQVSWCDRKDNPEAVQYGQLLALAAIAESLAALAAEKRPAVETDWQQEFEHAKSLLRDVLNDIPPDAHTMAIDVARNMLDMPGATPLEFMIRER
jgi:hypothetical protein